MALLALVVLLALYRASSGDPGSAQNTQGRRTTPTEPGSRWTATGTVANTPTSPATRVGRRRQRLDERRARHEAAGRRRTTNTRPGQYRHEEKTATTERGRRRGPRRDPRTGGRRLCSPSERKRDPTGSDEEQRRDPTAGRSRRRHRRARTTAEAQVGVPAPADTERRGRGRGSQPNDLKTSHGQGNIRQAQRWTKVSATETGRASSEQQEDRTSRRKAPGTTTKERQGQRPEETMMTRTTPTAPENGGDTQADRTVREQVAGTGATWTTEPIEDSTAEAIYCPVVDAGRWNGVMHDLHGGTRDSQKVGRVEAPADGSRRSERRTYYGPRTSAERDAEPGWSCTATRTTSRDPGSRTPRDTRSRAACGSSRSTDEGTTR